MCLNPVHKNALIATRDIRCYKLLIKRNSDLFTPFQKERIVFKNGIAIQETDNFGYDSIGDIDKGIHSCQRRFDRIIGRNYYSIIPKGVQYYMGNCDDLVSLKLIIFKNRLDTGYIKSFINNVLWIK